MSTIASRKAKARRLQQYVRDLILGYFLDLDPGDVESTSMGVSGPDIKLSPKALKKFPYDVECKNDENKSIWAAWKQLQDRKKVTLTPMLIMKKNHHEELAVLRVKDLFTILAHNDVLVNGPTIRVKNDNQE